MTIFSLTKALYWQPEYPNWAFSSATWTNHFSLSPLFLLLRIFHLGKPMLSRGPTGGIELHDLTFFSSQCSSQTFMLGEETSLWGGCACFVPPFCRSLGYLVQEHVAFILSFRVPKGDMTHSYYNVLNVYVPPKCMCWNPHPQGDGIRWRVVFGRWLDHEREPSWMGLVPLEKRPQRDL